MPETFEAIIRKQDLAPIFPLILVLIWQAANKCTPPALYRPPLIQSTLPGYEISFVLLAGLPLIAIAGPLEEKRYVLAGPQGCRDDDSHKNEAGKGGGISHEVDKPPVVADPFLPRLVGHVDWSLDNRDASP